MKATANFGVPNAAEHTDPLMLFACLKYAQGDTVHEACTKFIAVMKTGLSCMSAGKKYISMADNVAGRIAKDHDDQALVRFGTCISNFLNALDALQSFIPDPAGGSCSNGSLRVDLIFSQEELGSNYEIFFDAVGLRASQFSSNLERCSASALQLACGFQHGAEQWWRKDLGASAEMNELKAASKSTIKKIDGTQLKTSVEKLEKAGAGRA